MKEKVIQFDDRKTMRADDNRIDIPHDIKASFESERDDNKMVSSRISSQI